MGALVPIVTAFQDPQAYKYNNTATAYSLRLVRFYHCLKKTLYTVALKNARKLDQMQKH